MPIKNYTTTISAAKSVSEIVEMLATHGAARIQQEYNGGRPVSIAFQIDTPMGTRGFILPCHSQKVFAVLKEQKVKCDELQAEKVAWRILKDWVAAQMAILETEMVSIDEIFLPYMADKTGKTLYAAYSEGQFLLEGRSKNDGY